MARTVVGIDEELPAEAAVISGTPAEVAAVNAALTDAVNRRKRASFPEWLAEGGLPDLPGPARTDSEGTEGSPQRQGKEAMSPAPGERGGAGGMAARGRWPRRGADGRREEPMAEERADGPESRRSGSGEKAGAGRAWRLVPGLTDGRR